MSLTFVIKRNNIHTHNRQQLNEHGRKDNKETKVAATLSNRRDNNINFYHIDSLHKENILPKN